MLPDVPVLILAAGQSTRMRGGDKLLEPVDGVPLLARQVASARAISSQVFVTLPAPPHPRYVLAAGATAVPVPDAALGMSVSLRAGIAALPADAPAVLILLADLPELTDKDLATVLQARSLHPGALIWRGMGADGLPGHPIVFDAALFPEFADLEGDSGAQRLIVGHKDRLCPVPLPHQHATTDLDSPEDWAAWRTKTGR